MDLTEPEPIQVELTESDPSGDDLRISNSPIEKLITWLIVLACCGFVFYSLHPELILANTTPTGGDMGAHVWGPRFLRDHLLGQFRISGWTQDWYAGFPAYVFYMVVPSLMILWLAASPPLWTVPLILGALAGSAYKLLPRVRVPWVRHLTIGVFVFATVLAIPVPYNMAFKLVAISGLISLPVAACVLANSLRAPFPVPPLVALATLPFIYDKGFTILGGNGASTMAGEFAFSISLSLAIFYLAVLFRGVESGRWRVPGAILLALTVLCHIIPAIFVVIVTVLVVPVLRREPGGVSRDMEIPVKGEPATEESAKREPEAVDPTSVALTAVDPTAVDQTAVDPELFKEQVSAGPEEPWWTRSRFGSAVATGVIVALFVLVSVDRAWLAATGTHTPNVSGPARLQHLFPAFASIAALALFTGFQPRFRDWLSSRAGSASAVTLTILAGGVALLWPRWWVFALVALFLAGLYFVPVDWRALRWLVAVAPVAALTTAFWMLPFLAGSTYMNDMGWEKYTRYWDYLLAVPELDSGGMPLRSIILVLAGLGLVLSVAMKVRMGWFMGLVVLVFAWMFRYFPQYRLWNARLLPFYFLAIYLLAGMAGGLVIRFLVHLVLERAASEVPSERVAHNDPRLSKGSVTSEGIVTSFAALGVTVVVLVALLGSFKQLPGGRVIADPKKPSTNVFRWAGVNLPIGIVPDWAAWNFSGVERKPAYPEFRGIVDMMRNVGNTNGCGRAFWEFDPALNRFGTTMSLMMLPYYSGGCIGSMEGLYFEASTTTPFHFLMQSALSVSPSRAQREMPYSGFDIDLGIRQMQLMGVRYYMASSDQAIEAASSDRRLDKVADETFTYLDNGVEQQHRWVVFEVRGVRLVEGLENDPVVLQNANDHIDGWVYDPERSPRTQDQIEQGTPGSKTAGPAVRWFMDPSQWDVFLATSGPSNWPRATAEGAQQHRKSNPAVSVGNVRIDQQSVSFDVDRTGVPVLVKVSYFPNWRVSGATGPYRVTPNFMVVVPTQKHVTLTYGRSAADLAGVGLTSFGVAGLFGLAVLDDRRRRCS